MTPEAMQRVAILRSKAASGELTEAEMAEAIRYLRQDRVGAQIASDASRRKKAIAAVPDADSLLDELKGL
jgi:hypothetical protein